ncbi:MAG: polyphosphate polymerase domain-containing protein [Eubacteriales bacterium]|nr:polyphosphate polymerase domain-containing protein [Eubacteriales bacterium]
MKNVDAGKYRHELKYICSLDMLRVLEQRIKLITDVDRHADADNSYIVSSLYFDNYNNACCHDNDLGIDWRYKYRIRIYGGNTHVINLEKKLKYNNRGIKTFCKLSKQQYMKLYHGDVSALLTTQSHPLLLEFCTKVRSHQFTPKIIVRYRRKAFTAIPGHVRITMDTNCAASYQTDRFLTNDMTLFPIQEKGLHLLEVKYDEFLPDYIKQALQLNMLRQTSFSKYYISRQAMQKYWR